MELMHDTIICCTTTGHTLNPESLFPEGPHLSKTAGGTNQVLLCAKAQKRLGNAACTQEHLQIYPT